MSKGADFEKAGIKIRKGFYIFSKILLSGSSTAYYVLWLKFLQIIFIPIDFLLFLVEKNKLKIKVNKEFPLILVVGIQRTGSTLVSQFIEKTFPFFPIGNFNTIFKRSAYYLHKWFAKFYKKSNNTYKNYYGISKGIFSIGDSYEVWDKWFGKNHYVIPSTINDERLSHLTDYFSSLYKAYNRPILTKNNRNSLLIPVFRKVFKNGFYVIVKRDPVAVIRSTLEASKDFFGNGDLLWGLYPNSEFDTNDYENIIEAATVQFLMLDKLLDNQIKDLEIDSYIIVDYNEFCANPMQFQKNLVEKLKSKIDFDHEYIVFREEPFTSSKRLNKLQIDDQINKYLDKWRNKI